MTGRPRSHHDAHPRHGSEAGVVEARSPTANRLIVELGRSTRSPLIKLAHHNLERHRDQLWPCVDVLLRVSASGVARAQSPAIAQNPVDPNRPYSGPEASVSTTDETPAPSVP